MGFYHSDILLAFCKDPIGLIGVERWLLVKNTNSGGRDYKYSTAGLYNGDLNAWDFITPIYF